MCKCFLPFRKYMSRISSPRTKTQSMTFKTTTHMSTCFVCINFCPQNLDLYIKKQQLKQLDSLVMI